MISIQNLSFNAREKTIFRNFSFEIGKGQKVLLNGPSGSGKSTILKMILGFLEPSLGKIYYDKQELSQSLIWDIRKRTAYVPQQPQIGTGKVIDIIRELFQFKVSPPMPTANMINETAKLLSLDTSLFNQPFESLSGGEKQRLCILIALLSKKQFFLLDEATASLDFALQKKVVDIFSKRGGWTVLAASHDPVWREGSFRIVTIPEGAAT